MIYVFTKLIHPIIENERNQNESWEEGERIGRGEGD